VKDNIAWLFELFLLVLVLCGAIGLGIAATMSGSGAAEVLSIFLFVICLAVGAFFATGQEERLRTLLFGAFVFVTALLFIFSLALEGVKLQILTPLLGQ
jgi:hypothetical protein